MKKCVNCGNVEYNNTSACTQCGGTLVEEENVTCPNCGAELAPEAVFCNSCGISLVDTGTRGGYEEPTHYEHHPRSYAYSPPPPRNSNKGALTVLLTVLCTLIVVCLVILTAKAINDWGEPEPTPTPEPTATNVVTPTAQPTVQPTTAPTPTPAPTIAPTPTPAKTGYAVYKGNYTWTQANANARAMGGHLICINSPEEFEYACSLAEGYGMRVFWMGASLDYGRQSWYSINWQDGTGFSNARWRDGEPSEYENGLPELYLMAFKPNDEPWYFNDAVNDPTKYYPGKMGYIVEYGN